MHLEAEEPVNWRHISWMAGLLAVAVTFALVCPLLAPPTKPITERAIPSLRLIPRKAFSREEFVAIQETFWTKIQGRDRVCAGAYVDKYMAILRDHCEISGDGDHIGGGCAHLTNPMNYPEVLAASLSYCGVKF